MGDNDLKIAELRLERKRVREDVYDLGVRFNAGETEVRAALDAAIRRSDELEAEIVRLTPSPPAPRGGHAVAAMYGPPAPMYGPPGPSWSRGFFDWLFGRK